MSKDGSPRPRGADDKCLRRGGGGLGEWGGSGGKGGEVGEYAP